MTAGKGENACNLAASTPGAFGGSVLQPFKRQSIPAKTASIATYDLCIDSSMSTGGMTNLLPGSWKRLKKRGTTRLAPGPRSHCPSPNRHLKHRIITSSAKSRYRLDLHPLPNASLANFFLWFKHNRSCVPKLIFPPLQAALPEASSPVPGPQSNLCARAPRWRSQAHPGTL